MISIHEKHWDRYGFALTYQTNGDDSDDTYKGLLNIHIGKMNVYLNVPVIIKAKEDKIYPDWDAATKARLGRDYYIKYTKKMYGFTCTDEHIHTYYGIQPGSWSRDDKKNSDHTKLFSYPWNFEHVRHDAYYADGSYACAGEHFNHWKWRKNEPKNPIPYEERPPSTKESRLLDFTEIRRLELPKDEKVARNYKPFMGDYDNWSGTYSDKLIFTFVHYSDPSDKTEILTKLNIEEREWLRGRWGWLRYILKHVPGCRITKRCIDIEFSEEVGSRKGSWKGGTVGMSYEMLPKESILSAWARFCNDKKEQAYFTRR